jgi:tight adherence protein C
MCRRLVALALVLAGLSLLAVVGPTHAAEEASGRAIIPPRGTPTVAGQDDVLIVDEVRTDQFPKLSARFSINPLEGRPPSYLDLHDIAIVNDGVLESPLAAHTVGRVPTSGPGQYEVTWFSSSGVEAGTTIAGRLAISINNRPEIGTGFTFVRPYPQLAEAPVSAPVVNALIPVTHPDPGRINQPLASSLAAILAGTAFLTIIGGLIWQARWRQAQDRLIMWVSHSAEHRAVAVARASQSRRSLTVPPAVQFFARWGTKLVPSAQAERLRRSLVLAGRPTTQHYTRFVATKAGLAFGLFMVGFWLMLGLAPFATTVMVATTMAVTGFMLPGIWLGRVIKQRQHEIKKALPDALDLITIGVSAGLAFDGALGEVTEKWDNALSHEFGTLLGELRMGMGRRQALLNLADRTQVDEIQIMVSQLIQADELGMSLTETLLTLANQMRLRRRQAAEELAHKAAIKMLIPLVFLIFPALFIVILGPAAADMIGFVSGGATGP